MVDIWAWTFPGGKVNQISDVTDNDSDKTITVPAGKKYKILWIYTKLVTTATVGNRVLQCSIRDASDNILYTSTAANQAASATVHICWTPGCFVKYTTHNFHHYPFPNEVILPSGFDLRIYDSAAVDAAADDMHIRMIVLETDS